MIQVRDLSIVFNGKTVLDHVNLEVSEGERMVLLGKNGSGKSVLLKAVAGLIRDYEGEIHVNGMDMRHYHDAYSDDAEGERPFTVSYVFQKGGLFDSMNVFDNVAFGLRRLGTGFGDIEALVVDSLRRVGLSGNEGKLPSELSGGMQKRVGLARAICMNPDVILYDDPTAGLDPILSDSIADLIIEIAGTYKTTSIIVTHDVKVARKIAMKVALLYNASIVLADQADSFFSMNNPYALQFIEGNIEGPIDSIK